MEGSQVQQGGQEPFPSSLGDTAMTSGIGNRLFDDDTSSPASGIACKPPCPFEGTLAYPLRSQNGAHDCVDEPCPVYMHQQVPVTRTWKHQNQRLAQDQVLSRRRQFYSDESCTNHRARIHSESFRAFLAPHSSPRCRNHNKTSSETPISTRNEVELDIPWLLVVYDPRTKAFHICHE
jgi:hypothetical protein